MYPEGETAHILTALSPTIQCNALVLALFSLMQMKVGEAQIWRSMGVEIWRSMGVETVKPLRPSVYSFLFVGQHINKETNLISVGNDPYSLMIDCNGYNLYTRML